MSTPAEKSMATGINVDLVMIDGFVQSAMIMDNLKRLKDLPIRGDDIFLCTYPKSGNILKEMVNNNIMYLQQKRQTLLLLKSTNKTT